jgi:hypothetical protein
MTRAEIDALYEARVPPEEYEARLKRAEEDMKGEEGVEIREMIAWFLRRYPDPLDRLRYIRRKVAEANALRGIAAPK